VSTAAADLRTAGIPADQPPASPPADPGPRSPDTVEVASVPIRPARLTLRNFAPILVLGVAVYVLLPQAAHAGTTIAALRTANPAWIAVVALSTACTYLAGAAVWMATTPVPLALGRTFAVQLAAASANRVTPAGLGGMATNINYLRRAGATRAQAVTATALNSGAGFIVHVIGLAAATVLGARGAGWSIPSADLADHWPVLIAITLGLAAAGAWKWAAFLRRRLRPIADDIVATARRMIAHPARTASLLAASSGVTAGYAVAFAASEYAYGASAPVAKLAVVYLGASAIAAAAPTPGGLGALDAALVAGLGAAGTPPAAAVAAVLTYRTVTYWLPVIPGLIAQRTLRNRAILGP
jgi:glycosyltransferase 2 family protein